MLSSLPRFAVVCAALALIVGGCSDSNDPDNNNAGDAPALTSEYYAQAKINGTYETQQSQNGPTVYITPGYEGSSGPSNISGYVVAQGASFSKVIYNSGSIPALDPTYRSISIWAIRSYADQPYLASQYNMLMHQGSMPFGSIINEVDGIEIRWRDAAGTIWSTAFGSGDQTGSSFTIDSYTPIAPVAGQSLNAHYKATGTFSATLYNTSGNTMTITDGKFSVPVVYY